MQKTAYKPIYPIYFVLYVGISYLFVFMLKCPELAITSCKNALSLCFFRVIPTLFPFAVLSNLIFSSNIPRYLGKIFEKTFPRLMKISAPSVSAVIAGSLFGFPLGTKSAVSLYEEKFISKKECERLICFCSNTGPAFVLGVVGSAIGNPKIAFCIYLCQIISSLIIALFLRDSNHIETVRENTSKKNISLLSIPASITSAVLPILNICAFVCFFSFISASVENLLKNVCSNDLLYAAVSGFIELTNGIERLSYLPLNNTTVYLASFFVGFSGLSVILQSINIFAEYRINSTKFILSKLFQGIICGFLCVILCNFLKLY